jgi:hypothetical protein
MSPGVDGDAGWYLYGITLGGTNPVAHGALARGVFGGGPIELARTGDLAAVVQRVPLAAIDAATADQVVGWLEEMARRHHDVIAAIHRERAILPAKFGSIYATIDDLTQALVDQHDALRGQLERVAGHDEWGVRVYVDGGLLRARAVEVDPTLRELEHSAADATPGRAYLLRRKLADERLDADERAARDLAAGVYDRLAAHAAAGLLGPRRRTEPGPAREAEVLRAAFLVRRADSGDFIAAFQAATAERAGLRGEYSGPWPPYSFAGHSEEVSA